MKLAEKAIDIELALRRSIEEEEEEEEEEEFTWQEEQPAKGSGYQEPAEGNDGAAGNNNFMTAPGFQLSDGAVGRNDYGHNNFTPLSSDDDNTESVTAWRLSETFDEFDKRRRQRQRAIRHL